MDTSTNNSVNPSESLSGDLMVLPVKQLNRKSEQVEILTDRSEATSHLDSVKIDGRQSKPDFTRMRMGLILFSVYTYLVDMGTDCNMAATYYKTNDSYYFGLTLTFVLVPALTMSLFSARWYYKDYKNPNIPTVSKRTWFFRILCLFFLVSPVARYADTLRYGLQSRKAKKHKCLSKMGCFYARMAHEDADASLLRLFECFMESAPQLVLQLYILARGNFVCSSEGIYLGIYQIYLAATIVTSIGSLAWGLTAYNRKLRLAQIGTKNMDDPGTTILFFTHLFGVSARVIALSLFASTFTWFVWPVVLAHWFLMFICLWLQNAAACSNMFKQLILCFVLAIIHVFTFFNAKPGRTRFRYALFYTVCFLENTALILLWWGFMSEAQQGKWYRYPALIGHFVSFALSIILLGVYYKYLHPNLSLNNVTPSTEIDKK